MNRVSYPEKFMPKHVAIYSEQFINSDNTQNKIELYRLKHSKTESQNLTEQTSYDYEQLIHFLEFILDRTNYEKINKTDINLTRFIFIFCSSH